MLKPRLPSNSKYRDDIDGLRAISVLAVVAFHAFPDWATGGFVGVDVFFVISGYLISEILFRNFENDTFSLADFYSHRIRRIFPALIVILIFCLTLGWFSLLADEFMQLGKHMTAGATFVSNFALLSEAGYFDNSAETKPLLHLWSLGIEEQFYILYPLILWAIYKYKLNLFKIIISLLAISFLFNIIGVKHNIDSAFYAPQSRIWELLFGSLLAHFIHYKDKRSTCPNTHNNTHSLYSRIITYWPNNGSIKFGNILSATGFALLIFGILRINKKDIYPGWWALIPVTGSVLIILAGSNAWLNRKILSNKIAIWVGLVSFPLYLWHWPLISFVNIIESSSPSIQIRILAIIVSIAMAWITYEYIEVPIRYGKHNKKYTPILLALMASLGIIGSLIYNNEGFVYRKNIKELANDQKGLIAPRLINETDACNKLILKFSGNCIALYNDNPTRFDFIFLGDSHARALAMSLANAGQTKYSFIQIGKSGCPFVKDVDRFLYGQPYKCNIAYNETISYLKSLKSRDIAFISMYYTAYYTGNGYNIPKGSIHLEKTTNDIPNKNMHPSEETYPNIFENGFNKMLLDIAPIFNRVIIVLQPPEMGFNMRKCVNRPFSTPIKCTVKQSDMLTHQNDYRKAVEAASKRFKNVTIYDPTRVFCYNEVCNSLIDERLVYRDDNHINQFGSALMLEDIMNLVKP